MHKRTVAAVAATLLAVSLFPATATADPVAAEPESETDNIEHVTNVQLPEIPGRSGAGRATDSDFVEFTVPEEGWELPEPTEVHPGVVLPPPDYTVEPGETRQLNLMGTYNRGMHVLDITDRENPVLVAIWDCGVLQADVFAFQQEQEDGSVRQLAAYTQDATSGGVRASDCFQDLLTQGWSIPGNARGTFIADVTDPYRPSTVSFLQMRKGSHQTTVHPSGDYVYNSAAVVAVNPQAIGSIEVFDVSTPEEPELVAELMLQTGLDSHDMTFNEDGTRLYSAALTHSFVINTEDPADPQIISRIIDPSINIHHDAHAVTVDTPAGERTYMLIGDEQGGAGVSVYCPGGGIHVYDVTVEEVPVKVGAFFIEDTRVAAPCTAHVIQVLPDQELLVMGWYNGGVRVLDYSGLANLVAVGKLGVEVGITEVAHSWFDDSTLWSAKVLEVEEDGSFYIYGGDMARHVDVWRFDANGDGDGETTGLWMTPDAALQQAVSTPVGYTPYCLLGE